jgi:IS5 family transposase
MTAKVDLFRLKKEHRDGDDDDHYVDRNSPDPDARFGRKTSKRGFYGYKCHVVQDADSEFIVQALTTSGNVPDGSALPVLAQPQAKALTGDKAYDSKNNRSHLEALGVVPGLYPRFPRPGRPRKSWRERPKIERKFAECKQFHGLRRARYWGAGQSGHPNLNGGPGGKSQTLGHRLKASKSGLLMGICGSQFSKNSY